MQVSTINPIVLTGQTPAAGGGLTLAPTAGDPTMPGEIQVSPANPGDGILAEASEPLPAHLDNSAPAALAAPAPSATVTGEPGTTGSSTGEPESMYTVPLQGAGS